MRNVEASWTLLGVMVRDYAKGSESLGLRRHAKK